MSSSSVSIQISNLQFPFKIRGHVAVSSNDKVIVWGGTHEDMRWVDSSMVYVHQSGSWTEIRTRGRAPRYGWECAAVVANEQMFVICPNVIYSLDLNTWMWTLFHPRGEQPQADSGGNFWCYNGGIYGFQTGEGHDQFFCYNISNNSWEWPEIAFGSTSDQPYYRKNSLTVINRDTVYLFGGIGKLYGHMYNDLYTLDMNTNAWKKIHRDTSRGEAPKIYTPFSTLTCISDSHALLIGPKSSRGLRSECWLLDLDKARQQASCAWKQDYPTSIWKRLPNLRTTESATVLEPISNNLWMIGGMNGEGEVTSNVQEISINNVPQRGPRGPQRGPQRGQENIEEQEQQENREIQKCCICYDRPPQVVLVPCGHMNICAPCAHEWNEKPRHEGGGACPNCRKRIRLIQPFVPL